MAVGCPYNGVMRPELLAPAGDRDCLRAAVENGADAVYFGLDKGFNARARATNLSLDELPEIMRYLHRRGVKGYVTLNTLVFSDELEELEGSVRAVAAAGVDAVLVQDLGVARLVRAVCPDLPMHASTQMTLTSAECIRFAETLGIERVVLARELSLDEITDINRDSSMPLEAFVHGALCVAYSGQCLTSESLGGRSANRGQCAQACRMTYELICDGADVDLGDQKYLLSPQDLAAFDIVPQLIAAGVMSFKIEGRLKSPEYVANITKHYRQAIDAAVAGQPLKFSPRNVEEMELSFSRGFSHGWLDGNNHKRLVPGLSSAKRGVLLGHVRAVKKGRVEIELSTEIKPGDGLVFAGNRAENKEQGGRVYEVFPRGGKIVELAFAHGAIDFSVLWNGQQVWKTDDPELAARWKKTYTGADPVRRVPLKIAVRAVAGELLVVDAWAENGATCRVESTGPLAVANKHPASEQMLREQLGRLGGSVYQLSELTSTITGGPMIPLSVLGQLRHEMIDRLDTAGETSPERRITSESVLAALRPRLSKPSTHPSQIHVLCRSLKQLTAVLECGVDSVYVDFQDIREYRDAVEVAHAAEAKILLATPRIQKPGEMGIFHAMAKHHADGMLVRNMAGMLFCREHGIPFVADFSLNVTNELTAQLLHEHGAERLTASYDMNRDQLLGLVAAVPPEWLEVVAHQHMPMFHMEHCVFCAVLSPGTDKTNCGRPCDFHEVKLRDRIGMEHPLKADVGCRNTLFNAVPQSAAEAVPVLIERGVQHFRIELLNELADDSAATPRNVIGLYRDLLAGRITGREVWSRLQAANRVGVTRGTLEERRNPLAIL
jgi:putative protease